MSIKTCTKHFCDMVCHVFGKQLIMLAQICIIYIIHVNTLKRAIRDNRAIRDKAPLISTYL